MLWLLGFPFYITANTNSHADSYYQWCRQTRRATVDEYQKAKSWDKATALEATAHEDCWRPSGHITIQGTLQEPLFWGMVLGALAIFWIIGGIIFGTARWIARGFNRA